MRKRFIAMVLAGGLMLGVCGCGSKSISADEYMAQIEQDETSMQGDSLLTPSATEVAETPSAVQESEAAPQDAIPEDGIVPNVDEPKEKPETNIDPADYMATYVWEHELNDGYQFRETIGLSPIFSDTEKDLADMYAMWEALGGTADEIPSKERLYEMSQPLRSLHTSSGFNNLKFIVGTRMVENLTEGFPITTDNPCTVSNGIRIDDTIDNPDEDATAKNLVTTSATTLLFYANDRSYEVSVFSDISLGKAHMTSDTWGPCPFIIVLPDSIAPNYPDGFAYDSLYYMIGIDSPEWVSNKVNFTLYNWNE